MALDVICVGEALVDFLPEEKGEPVHRVMRWRRCSGGSLANVAVGLARLGAQSGLVGVVGADEFGEFLAESLASEGVDVSHLRRTPEGKTGLVFISLSDSGERSFAFYRTRSAELFLSARDVDVAFLARAKAVHFGTNSLLWPEAQEAMARIAREARGLGRIVSCDPNLRLGMWPRPEELKALLDRVIPSCTLVKLSEDEIEFVTGEKEADAALAWLSARGVKLPVVTQGEKGASFLLAGRIERVEAPAAKVVDTTGAGDGFMAGLLHGLTRQFADAAALERASVDELRPLFSFACRVGSKVVEQVGAVTGLPRLDDLMSGPRSP